VPAVHLGIGWGVAIAVTVIAIIAGSRSYNTASCNLVAATVAHLGGKLQLHIVSERHSRAVDVLQRPWLPQHNITDLLPYRNQQLLADHSSWPIIAGSRLLLR